MRCFLNNHILVTHQIWMRSFLNHHILIKESHTNEESNNHTPWITNDDCSIITNFDPYRRQQWCHSSWKVSFSNSPKIIQFAFSFELWNYIKYFPNILQNKGFTNSITGSTRPSFVQSACSVTLLLNFWAWTILLVPLAFPISLA